ncbi:MAG: Plug domain-containing protein, partial [Pirellulales bacterium]
MAKRCFRSTLVFSLVAGLSLSSGGSARAQSPSATASDEALPAGESSEGSANDESAGADDLDSLLDMADKNPEGLGKVNVATPSDPIVEGVSKKEEPLSESPGIVDVITAEDIEQFGAKNLFEVINWATSVYTTGSFLFPRNNVSIRGNLIKHEDNHVLVLINGRPFRDSTLGGVNLSIYTAFPIDTIERVEVIRGPS